MARSKRETQRALDRYARMIARNTTQRRVNRTFWKDFYRVVPAPSTKPFDLTLVEMFIGKECPYQLLELAHNLGVFALGRQGPTIPAIGTEPGKVAILFGRERDRREFALMILDSLVTQLVYPLDKARQAREEGSAAVEPFDWERLDRLLSRLRLLEDIQVSALSGLGGKFYRDHLLHTIRDTLLAGVLARSVYSLSSARTTSCLAAAMFHDLAYPISSGQSISESISEVLDEAYPSFNMRPARVTPRVDLRKALRRVFDERSIVDRLVELVGQLNHAPMGGVEFLSYFRQRKIPRPLKEAVQAICLHDPGVGLNISFRKHPVPFVFLIADELQDWGRPIGSSTRVPLDKLSGFRRREGKLVATFDYARLAKLRPRLDPPFSPLLQVQGKQHSLARLTFDGGATGLSLEFRLPRYARELSSILDFLPRIDRLVERLEDDYGVSAGLAKIWDQLHSYFLASSVASRGLFYCDSTRELVFTRASKLPRRVTGSTVGRKLDWTASVVEIRNALRSLRDDSRLHSYLDPVLAVCEAMELDSLPKNPIEFDKSRVESVSATTIALFRHFVRSLCFSSMGESVTPALSTFDGTQRSVGESPPKWELNLSPSPPGHPRILRDWLQIAITEIASSRLFFVEPNRGDHGTRESRRTSSDTSRGRSTVV